MFWGLGLVGVRPISNVAVQMSKTLLELICIEFELGLGFTIRVSVGIRFWLRDLIQAFYETTLLNFYQSSLVLICELYLKVIQHSRNQSY